MSSRLEAGERLGLIVKAKDDFLQPQYPEHLQHEATWTQHSQVASLTSKRNAGANDDAEAGTIDLSQVCQV